MMPKKNILLMQKNLEALHQMNLLFSKLVILNVVQLKVVNA
jgi:hypothetical protein